MIAVGAEPPAPHALLHCDAIATEAPESDRERSASYEPDNFFDRYSRRSTLELNYRHMMAREHSIVSRRLGLRGGDVLSVGAGWHPGRHLFPAPAFRIVAVDADPGRAADLSTTGRADEVLVGHAGRLDLDPGTFDVVLYRLVLHHIAFQGPLAPCFEEAALLLRPGGSLIAIEPGLWHPVGAALSLANRTGAATALHGTPDDIPLSPRLLLRLARSAGLEPELHAVTYGWRRLPPPLQRGLLPLDELGSRSRAAMFGHTLMLIARHGG
jgi:SAM-dependent methyltransferase